VAQLNSASDLPAGRQVSALFSSNSMAFTVYVIKSKKDGRLYKGLTSNIKRRLAEHNDGKNRSTKGFIPWVLVYERVFLTRVEARTHEKYLKSGIGREYLAKSIK
jgi:putative endonuclease